MTHLHDSAQQFATSGILYDHEGVLDVLQKSLSDIGRCVLFVGAPTSGKSMVARVLASNLGADNRDVVVVDAMQTGPKLARGVAMNLAGQEGFNEAMEAVLEATVPSAAGLQ